MIGEEHRILPNMIQLLQNGFENEVDNNSPRNIALVLGLAGSYKYDLIRLIIAKNKQVNHNININTNNQNSLNNTITVRKNFPDFIIDSIANTAFYDYSEFDESKTVEEEISAKFLLNKVINYADSIKIILTIPEFKIKSSSADEHINLLLDNVVEIIQDFDKLENSIALVVTKVANDNLASDGNFIEKIADNLRKYSTDEKSALKKQNLINILLKNNNGVYTNIGVFRKPENLGEEISESEVSRIDLKSLEMVINVNTKFVKHDKNNFLYYITSDPLSCTDCLDKLVNGIKSGISIGLREIGQNIKQFYENEELRLKDYKRFHDEISLGIKSLEGLHNTSFSSTTEFLTKLIHLKDIHTMIPQKIILSINSYAEYLNFIQKSVNKSSKYSELEKIDSLSFRNHFISIIDEITEDLRNSQSWYTFLIDFHNSLSRYSAQEARESIKGYTKHLINEHLIWNDKEMRQKMELDEENDQSDINPSEYEERKQNIAMSVEKIITTANLNNWDQISSSLAKATISNTKLKFLSKMLESLLISPSDKIISTCSDNKLQIQGQFIKLSDVSKEEHSKCKGKPVKEIELFASNTVFIDGALNKTGEEIQLSIVAPTWEIIGKPKIILDGKPGEPHEVDTAPDTFTVPGAAGNDGLPGKPGGPSGSLLAIGSNFINEENLVISLVGGKGGPGQKGSDGVAGKDGNLDPKVKKQDGKVVNYLDICKQVSENIVKTCYECTDESNKCQNGGKGGKGGEGGKGGRKGRVQPIKLNGGYANIRGYITDGSDGPNGEHGNSKEGGLAKILKFRLCVSESRPKPIKPNKFQPVLHLITNENTIDKRCGPEKMDEKSFNSDGKEEPPFLNTRETAYILNDYKKYIISILGTDEKIREESLREFLDQIENDSHFQDLNDCMPLIIELQNLEAQFFELHKKVSLLPFYESLLRRTTQYAKSFYQEREKNIEKYDEQWFDDRRNALTYLYTATFSKIISIRDNKSSNMIINALAYLDPAIENIEKFNDISKAVLMDKVQSDYYNLMDDKIKEAMVFIPLIKDKTKNIIKNVDAEIRTLINEIQTLEGKVVKQRKELEIMGGKLKNAIAIRSFLAVPQIVAQILSLTGPIGQTVGTVITGSSMLIEALSVRDVPKENIKVEALPKVFDRYMSKIGEANDKREMLQKYLGAIEEEFKNTEKKVAPPPSVLELRDNLSNITKTIEEEKRSGVSPDKISEKTDAVKALLDQSVTKLGSTLADKNYTNNTIIKTWSKHINRAANSFSVMQVPASLFKSISADSEKVDLVVRAIKESGDQLKKLDMHKKEIYEHVIPQCRGLQKQLSELSNDSTADKSHAALDISKWKIQGMLMLLKSEMRKMTEGLSVQEDIARLMEELNYALSTMIDVYDRIQDYRDRKELADYIKDINPTASDTETIIRDVTLKNAVDKLKLIIQSNIVLEEHERAIFAIKQRVYPMAHKFLAEYQLPFASNLSISALATKAAEKLRNIKNQIEVDNITILKEDKFWFDDAPFTVEDGARGPFYVWKYAENKQAISRLLRGKEITLKSHITKSNPEFSAVKFRFVGIKFNFADKAAQKEFEGILKDFKLTMVHMGNSQYKCNDKFHVIMNDKHNFTVEYSTLLGNRVHSKIKKQEALLSPYTSWTISLQQNLLKRDFASLAQYENMTIDLALEGNGTYIHNTDERFIVHKICNDDLAKYYKDDETISGLTTAQLFNKEVLDEIPGIGYTEDQKPRSRIRRSLSDDELEQDEDEDLFSTSGAGSSMKSSFINNIFNLIGTGLVAYEYLNPVNKIKQWFNKYETNIDHEDFVVPDNNIPTDMKMLNVQPPADTELPKVAEMFIDDDLPRVNNLLNDATFCSHGNLLLLDLFIRSKSGVKYGHERLAVKPNVNLEYAQHLAYGKQTK
ncbi:hypothetical protein TSAR_017053 [Trichomalopsis sarcophagae]|uniref:Uncharacterized protein n=1 Tax=Trichomalopsis sarcophagae TaxID=543379 RepID=A0A232FH48_9HYME|nr:hypothetical protein TSAR_017053 [Trichomalopsis sarcophagae]